MAYRDGGGGGGGGGEVDSHKKKVCSTTVVEAPTFQKQHYLYLCFFTFKFSTTPFSLLLNAFV